MGELFSTWWMGNAAVIGVCGSQWIPFHPTSTPLMSELDHGTNIYCCTDWLWLRGFLLPLWSTAACN
jgi:hypothetical protein